ncbi:glycoside hydrolase family 61 protein [Jaapia argillacea MUCL 33604]|uniref:lytic cellulose monooxygenase (C4-dehydrogenating) n=1 Tax=Jaapia argillacea MUCL 33604 TaxID=933084 RepID=A0A067P992_9AGAM|nr:glycoside hydrolase family 61 protein [Jaapia argillacea MUCL 33604]
MKSFSTLFLSLLAATPLVSAHGFIKTVIIDGKTYQGNLPGGATNPSPIRQISTIDPVKGATNAFVFCGQNATVASMVAPANPGSTVTFDWADSETGNWPHNTGPLMTYMAKCGTTTCDQFDATNADFFKIDQVGKKSDGSTWWQQDIMNGDTFTLTLPQNIAPGDYLIRHEIIALHLANSMGGAEFYPSCTQVRIGGSGTGTPGQTVQLPGAYSDTDPGIYDPNVFNPGSPYTFPGPAISNLASLGAAITSPDNSTTVTISGSQGSPTGTTNSTSTPTGTGTATSAASSHHHTKCSLKTSSPAATSTGALRPRHVSRVMRRMLVDFDRRRSW